MFLEANGFGCSLQMLYGLETICTSQVKGGRPRTVIPLEFKARTSWQAEAESGYVHEALHMVKSTDAAALIIPQDRWRRQPEMMKARLLAHLEIFTPVYARNCEVRRIDKPTAAEFLSRTHAYGDAACKYRYGMFLKRSTGHIAKEGRCDIPAGTLIAVGTFSNARKWVKEDRTIRSYEWIRYASLPGLRISGGMGKILNAFINEVQPDDIMSYADLEWSEGTVYEQLGFTLEGQKEPVLFGIDSEWNRSPVKPGMTDQDVIAAQTGNLFYMNFGSNKYRLKLTEYE
jgi:hypothetical protein